MRSAYYVLVLACFFFGGCIGPFKIEYVGHYSVRQYKESGLKADRWKHDPDPGEDEAIAQISVPDDTAYSHSRRHMKLDGARRLTPGLVAAMERQQREADQPFRWSAQRKREERKRRAEAHDGSLKLVSHENRVDLKEEGTPKLNPVLQKVKEWEEEVF